MLDMCQTTYCAHFDSDIIFWAQDTYSWIMNGISLLETIPDALEVQPPLPKYHELASQDNPIPNQEFLCKDHTFMTARYYLMHSGRYKQLLETEMKDRSECDGNNHWENHVSCAACRQKWK